MSTYVNALFSDCNFKTLEESTVYNIPSNKSTIVSMLEFNDEIFSADLIATKNYYKGLLESREFSLNEGVFGSIAAFIENVILTISNLFSFVFSGFSGDKVNAKSKKIESAISKKVKYLENSRKVFTDKYNSKQLSDRHAEIKYFSRPSGYNIPNMIHIVGQEATKILNDIINQTNDLCSKVAAKQIGSEEVKNIINEIIEKDNKLKDLLSSIDIKGKFNTTTKSGSIAEYCFESYKNLDKYNKFIEIKNKEGTKAIPEIKNMIDCLEKVKNTMANDNGTNDDNAPIIRSLSSNHAEIMNTIAHSLDLYMNVFLNSLLSEINTFTSYVRELLNDNNEEDEEVVNDSALMEDCINIEFANYRWAKMQAYKEGIVREAKISAAIENNVAFIREMNVIHEGIGVKVKNAFTKMVDKIREIFKKFMEKVRANFTSDRNYIEKYKKVILGNRLPDEEYRGNDFLRGMDAVLNFDIPAFNYNAIKDKLNSNYEFLNYLTSNAKFKPRDYKFSFELTPDNASKENIAIWFKEYFGVCEKTNPRVTKASDIQARMKDIYDFMYDIRTIEKNFKKDLQSIEKMRDEVIKQNNNTLGVDPSKNHEDVNNTKVSDKVESAAISIINNLDYFIEAPTPGNPNADKQKSNQQYTDMTGRVASNTGGLKGRVANTDGSTNYGVGGANVEELNKHCDVYIEVVTKIIEAKLTALEALRTDFKYLFRRMVETYVTGNGKENRGPVNNQRNFIDLQNGRNRNIK